MTQGQAEALTALCRSYWPYDKGAQGMTGEAAFLLLESCDARLARDFVLAKAKAGERFAPTIGQIYAAVEPPEDTRKTKINLRTVRWVQDWGDAVARGADPNEAVRAADKKASGRKDVWR